MGTLVYATLSDELHSGEVATRSLCEICELSFLEEFQEIPAFARPVFNRAASSSC